MTRRPLYIIILLLSLSYTVWGQTNFEICDNGIDDDLDGFIDLNDSKCECGAELPSSLIPNPSFEERTCCPTANEMLNCAVGWVQASGPTTDYINTCGDYLGNTSIPAFAPLPLPDGEGAVGFRDGQANVGSNYKEYVGACLTETMKSGVNYKLKFFVGFRDNITGSKNLDIAIFGGTTCSQLPFGGQGCPANTSTYDELDIQSVSGSNEWVSVEFEFTPTKDYEVFIVGPSCAPNPNTPFSPYFYIDGLTLAETSDFGVPLENVEGSICNDDLTLSIIEKPGQSYQWYKDGIAIVGETNNSLSIINTPSAEGSYLVVINVEDGCISSKEYIVRVPPYYASQSATICEGDDYAIENTNWNEDGIYETTITAVDGCDSIITLDLEVIPTTYGSIIESICEGDTFSLFDVQSFTGGEYATTITNVNNCDSVLTIFLEEIPATSGIDIAPEVEVLLGDIIDLEPEAYDPDLITFSWADSDDNILSNEQQLLNLQPSVPETFTITGIDQYGCEVQEQVMVRIDRSSVNIYTPNIFSPDENGINDYFKFYTGNALLSVRTFVIFDRWGNIVYERKNITDANNLQGWDGFIDGKAAAQGVYGWMIEATFIDNTITTYSGDLTLIRTQ